MSSRSPRAASADLAAANAALDVCAALLRAQGDDAPAPDPQPVAKPEAKIDPAIERDRKRLGELEGAVEVLTNGFRGEGRTAIAAQAIAECAAKVIAEHREALAKSDAPQPQAPAPAPQQAVGRDYATQRALRQAIDRYFSYFEIPGTSWRLEWQLLSESGMPSATAYGSSPGGIDGSYSIALPDDGPWRSPTKLVALEAAPSKSTAIVTGAGKPTSVAKFFLVGLSWAGGAGSITLSRSKKKLANAVHVAYPGDGTVAVTPLDQAGNAAGPAAAQDGEASGYLDAVWWKMTAAVMGLVHARGDAITLTYQGASAETMAHPEKMAEAIMDGNKELLAKVDSEIDAEMRAKLAAKFDTVPARYRSRLRGLVLAEGSNPPSFEAAPTSVQVKAEPKKPQASAKPKAEAKPEPKAEPKKAEPKKPEPEQKAVPEATFDRATTVSRNVIPRNKALGSGPVPNPAQTMAKRPARPVISRPDDTGVRLFGQKTIDEKFDSLDLEIDWDDDDDDARTIAREDQTLPGVTPSIRRPTSVTIER